MAVWMKRIRLPYLIVSLLLWIASPLGAGQVTVFAAASLKTALDTLAPRYEAETGDQLRLVYAGSAVLARQISQGAPADVFLSANTAFADWLKTHRAPLRETILLENEIVLVAPAPASPVNLDQLPEGRIAIGLRNAVPAGIYTRGAFEALGLWERLEPRMVETDNVRAALTLVARGEVAFGVVYRSDAMAEPRVAIVAEFPQGIPKTAEYPMHQITQEGRAFFDYIQTPAAKRVFEAQGFEVRQ